MRTLKIVLLVFIVSITISAQWYQQNSGTTNNLFNVQFVTELIGWTTTEQVIYKTTDGGQNWQYQYTQNPIFQIYFNNENVGWISTWITGPTILKTTDGGDTWIEVYSYLGATEYIHDFEFINPDTGWIVGEETISSGKDGIVEFPVLFKETTDGGITWVDKNFPPNHPVGLKKIEAIDYMNLIVAGYDTLFKSTNGGITWQQLSLPPIYEPVDLQFINMDLGWVTGYGTSYTLYKTTNGGVSWLQQAQPVFNFQFITSQIGWYTVNNQIYSSTNGGDTWIFQNSNTNNTLNDIFFIDNNNGWAVGQNGTVLHTINGGVPVELTSFVAEFIESKGEVELSWITATETNNQGFDVERASLSTTPVQGWEKIGYVAGFGTTTEPKIYSFVDTKLETGKYTYRLKQIDLDGTYKYSKEVNVDVEVPIEYALEQNYPNPFNPSTTIKYSIPEDGFVKLAVYNMLGEKIISLVNNVQKAGRYEINFNASNLASGIYLYRLEAQNYVSIKKMILIK
jgi:photosystem II stability/assembly factor-like uncharacterized protein